MLRYFKSLNCISLLNYKLPEYRKLITKNEQRTLVTEPVCYLLCFYTKVELNIHEKRLLITASSTVSYRPQTAFHNFWSEISFLDEEFR